jgi:hypothetical protein
MQEGRRQKRYHWPGNFWIQSLSLLITISFFYETGGDMPPTGYILKERAKESTSAYGQKKGKTTK